MVTGQPVDATLSVWSDAADPVADGTEIGWLGLGEFIGADLVTFAGEARARLRYDEPGIYSLLAIAGMQAATASVAIGTPEMLLRITASDTMLAGDMTGDGPVSISAGGGDSFNVDVKATSRVEVSGGAPGTRLSLGLGTLDAPNRAPEAQYLMDTLDGGIVPDLYWRHPAQATEGVTVASDSQRGSTYLFGGGSVRIPAEDPFAQPVGLQGSLFVKPGAGGAGGVLIRRQDAFSLELIPESGAYRLRLTAREAGADRSIESTTQLRPDVWTEVHFGLLSGTLALQVGEEALSEPVAAVAAGAGDLVIGEAFAGELDDLRLYHVSGVSPPILAIVDAEGQEHDELEATFDANGSAFFNVRSRGTQIGRSGIFEGVLDDEPDELEKLLRGNCVGLRAKLVEMLRETKGPGIRAYTKDVVAMATLMLLEIVRGGDENTPPPFVIFEALLGLKGWPGAAMDIRDVILLLEGIIDIQDSDSDKMTLAGIGVTPQQVIPKVRRVEKAIAAAKVLRRMIKRGARATHFAKWVQRAVTDPVVAKRLEKTAEAAVKHGDEVGDAVIDVMVAVDKRWKDMDHLEAVFRAADDVPAVAKALKQALDSHNAKLLQDVLTIAARHQPVTAKMLSGMVKAMKAAEPPPSPARMRRMASNFPDARQRWEKFDDLVKLDSVTGLGTPGAKRVLNQLTSLRKPGVYIQDSADAALDYAKRPASNGLGGVVDAFERRIEIPKTSPGQIDLRRNYDLSQDLGGGRWLDVDVKNWTQPFGATGKVAKKEARKLQKDIISKWLADPTQAAYDGRLRWAINSKGLPNGAKVAEFRVWMLKQFDSRLVRSRIFPTANRTRAKQAFEQALNKRLLELF